MSGEPEDMVDYDDGPIVDGSVQQHQHQQQEQQQQQDGDVNMDSSSPVRPQMADDDDDDDGIPDEFKGLTPVELIARLKRSRENTDSYKALAERYRREKHQAEDDLRPFEFDVERALETVAVLQREVKYKDEVIQQKDDEIAVIATSEDQKIRDIAELKQRLRDRPAADVEMEPGVTDGDADALSQCKITLAEKEAQIQELQGLLSLSQATGGADSQALRERTEAAAQQAARIQELERQATTHPDQRVAQLQAQVDSLEGEVLRQSEALMTAAAQHAAAMQNKEAASNMMTTKLEQDTENCKSEVAKLRQEVKELNWENKEQRTRREKAEKEYQVLQGLHPENADAANTAREQFDKEFERRQAAERTVAQLRDEVERLRRELVEQQRQARTLTEEAHGQIAMRTKETANLFSSRIKECDANLHVLDTKLKEADRQLSQANSQLAQANNQLAVGGTQLAEARNHNGHLAEQLNKRDDENRELQKTIDSLRKKGGAKAMHDLQRRTEEQRIREAAQTGEALLKKDNRIRALAQEAEKWRTLGTQLEHQTKQKEAQMVQEAEALRLANAALQGQFDQQSARANDMVASLQATVESKGQQIAELTRAIDANDQVILRLQGESEQTAQLRNELAACRGQLQNLVNDKAALEAQHQNLAGEKAALETQVTQLQQAQGSDSSQAVQSLQDEKDRLQGELESAKATYGEACAKAEEKANAATQALEDLQPKYNEAYAQVEKRATDAEQGLGEAKATYEKAYAEAETKWNRDLDGARATFEQAYAEAEEKVKQAEENVQRAEEKAKAAIQDLEVSKFQFSEVYSEAETKATKANQELDEAKAKIQALEDAGAEKDLEAKFSQLQTNAQESESKRVKELADATKQCQQAKDELAALTTRNAEQEKDLATATRQLEDLKKAADEQRGSAERNSQLEFVNSFPQGYDRIPTSGERLLCGLYALQGSLRAQRPGLSVPTVDELRELIDTADAEAFNLTSGDPTLARDRDNFRGDQLANVLREVGGSQGWDLRLGIATERERFVVPAPEGAGSRAVVWIWNDGNQGEASLGHWEGLRAVDLWDQMARLTADLRAKEAKAEELQGKIAELEKRLRLEVEMAKVARTASERGKAAQLEQEKKSLQAKLEEQKALAEREKTDLHAARQKQQGLEDAVSQLKQEKQALQDKITELRKEKDALQTQVDRLEKDKEALEAEKAELDALVKERDEELEALQEIIAKPDDTVNLGLHKKVDRLEQEAEERGRQIEEKDGEIARLAEVKEMQKDRLARLDSKVAKLEGLRAQVAEKDRAIGDLTREIADLKEGIDDKQAEADGWEVSHEHVKKLLDDSERRRQQEAAEHQAAEGKICELEGEIARAKESQAQAVKERIAAHFKVEDLEERIADLRAGGGLPSLDPLLGPKPAAPEPTEPKGEEPQSDPEAAADQALGEGDSGCYYCCHCRRGWKGCPCGRDGDHHHQQTLPHMGIDALSDALAMQADVGNHDRPLRPAWKRNQESPLARRGNGVHFHLSSTEASEEDLPIGQPRWGRETALALRPAETLAPSGAAGRPLSRGVWGLLWTAFLVSLGVIGLCVYLAMEASADLHVGVGRFSFGGYTQVHQVLVFDSWPMFFWFGAAVSFVGYWLCGCLVEMCRP